MKVISHEPTALAYDGRLAVDPENPRHTNPITQAGHVRYAEDIPAGWRLVIHYGLNHVSDKDFHFLEQDANFEKHVDAGTMVVQQDDPVTEEVELSEDDLAFVKEWDGLSKADQAAMYPSLSDEQKALVPAPVAKAAK